MKGLNKKITTLLLAGACAASLTVATVGVLSSAEETTAATTYAVSDVFSGKASAKEVSEKKYVSFELGDDEKDTEYALYKRDLALKWFTAKNTPAYMHISFQFEELNFKSTSFTFETASSVATEEEKATNAVKFTVEGGKLFASVVNGETEGSTEELSGVTANSKLDLTLGAGDAFDCYKVFVNGTEIGQFTNVAGAYADYSYQKTHPLEITADVEGENKAKILLLNINGQSFDNLNGDGKIVDNAAPVLVVNEELTSFAYGTAFSLNYEKIDALQSSSLTETKKFYQWNPADKAEDAEKLNDLTSSNYFMDSVYYTKADGSGYSRKETSEFTKQTSVKREDAEGREFVTVQFTLEDKAKKKETYDLAWYVPASELVSKSLDNKDSVSVSVDYIQIKTNDNGAQYKHIEAKKNPSDEYGQNVVDGGLAAQVASYQNLLKEAAKDVEAGSSSSVKLPALDWFIDDDGGYRALKFTISYKTPSSSSAKTSSSLSYNGLKVTTTEEGTYEFKVFAVDKSGNNMKYYDKDGKLVSVSTSNIWDIEEIPSFTFEIAPSDIKVDEPTRNSNKKVEKSIDQTYSLSGLKILGASNERSNYALYRLDRSNVTELTESVITGVKYEAIRTAAAPKIAAGEKDYFGLYLKIYATELAKAAYNKTEPTEAEVNKILACFTEIKEYNANITEKDEEWDAYNKYNWNPTSKSFKTVEKGDYIILGDFYEEELPMQRAAAYKWITVKSSADVIDGESKFAAWVKNNVVSVVLFGVAALMLVAIVVLLLIKPSDETLEDVETKASKKKENKKE